ncbi:MAG: hypothetical protein NTZ33_04105 [Bacteroidetes bacterium]|nr:hypothetical protein [Bacteroidota bacterium]
MKKLSLLLLFLLTISLFSVSQNIFKAGDLKISLDNKGYFTEITNIKTQQNYLSKDTISPLLSLISQTHRYLPSSLQFNKKTNIISLNYNSVAVNIDIKVVIKNSHLTLEIVKAEPSAKIEAVVWGPIPLLISKNIGEIIGIVRDEKVAVGLQVLNVKTDGGDYSKEGTTFSRGQAALSQKWGSSIQAYSINREIQRFVDTWDGKNKNTPIIPIKGDNVVGSKIALFSCDEPLTLDWIEKIELAEGLPHPIINGVWTHKAFRRGHSYLIADYTEANIDKMLSYTKRAGLISLYHIGPFNNWGHYDLDTTRFPHGKKGLKICADKAKAAGLHLGVHTLTNFINTNDAYVSPHPDFRLALTGFGLLTANIDETTTSIPVSTAEYFDNETFNFLHSVKIGNEIIRYKSVTKTPPFILQECQRGAFSTKVAAHHLNDTLGKLYDHAYEVFFPNLDLQREIAKNLAKLFNETGIDHLDFDGYEGCLASGQGDYAVNLFAWDFYKNLNHTVLNGTSISKCFYWHINTFCNWGEPWYGGFKESMQEYRINNQLLFDRNFMPHMLGWYLLTKNTTKSEMEWMLAKAAAYDAGFAMCSSQSAIEENPDGLALLDLIKEWETARLGNAFSAEQRERMKNPKKDFHLEMLKDGEWKLYQYNYSETFIHEKEEKQPGEPTHSVWKYEQKDNKQALQFKIFVKGESGNISNTKIQIDNYLELAVPIELKAGQTLICNGTKLLRIYDDKGKQINTFTLNSIPEIDKATHQILFDTQINDNENIKVEFSLQTLGNAEKISTK